jgi:DDE superfamily endonuclease
MASEDFRGPKEWDEWSSWLSAGLHGRNRWRLGILLTGILFAQGRRTVSTWLRAAGVSPDYVNYYYFLASVGCNAKFVSWRLLNLVLRIVPLPERVLLLLDDSPTKRYGPKVEGADVHHNPTPGPADQEYLYGHVWVTLSLAVRHSAWGALALPLRAMLYVRQRTLEKIPAHRGWQFRTKLELAARLMQWAAPVFKSAGKSLWIAADGAYAKRPFLRAAREEGLIVVSRLRKDAHLCTVPPPVPPGQRRRGRPRKYGRQRISLAKRAGQSRGWQKVNCTLYGEEVTKTYKTFLATYRPAEGVIRVVLVKEEHGWAAFFCTDPNATVQEILEAFADRATIEQNFHDQKEVWGTGQQQVRNIWTNVGVFHLNLWIHTLVELWAWNLPHEQLCDRSASPWDDPDRRPSHANRRKALRQQFLANELTAITRRWSLPSKILELTQWLAQLAA